MKRLCLRTVCLSLFWLATQGSCFALLGENSRELDQRYGKFIPELTHRFGPLVVRCYFVRDTYMTMVMLRRGKSIWEAYSRADKQPLSDRTMQTMLKGNARGADWKSVAPEEGVDRQWVLGKKEAGAAYLATGNHPGLMVFQASWLPYAKDYLREQKSVRDVPTRPEP